ncbi:unnamed protein product [Ectocarpus sp. 13 AM-2016]
MQRTRKRYGKNRVTVITSSLCSHVNGSSGGGPHIRGQCEYLVLSKTTLQTQDARPTVQAFEKQRRKPPSPRDTLTTNECPQGNNGEQFCDAQSHKNEAHTTGDPRNKNENNNLRKTNMTKIVNPKEPTRTGTTKAPTAANKIHQ